MMTMSTSMTPLTDPVRVNVRRTAAGGLFDRLAGPADPRDLDGDVQRARQIADWLDTKFEVGGVRFGLDAIVGLVPVVGDLLGALAGVYPIWVARRHGLGKTVQARMAFNLAAEWAVGSVPLLGDAFDVAYKANVRNVKLLERAVEKARRRAGQA